MKWTRLILSLGSWFCALHRIDKTLLWVCFKLSETSLLCLHLRLKLTCWRVVPVELYIRKLHLVTWIFWMSFKRFTPFFLIFNRTKGPTTNFVLLIRGLITEAVAEAKTPRPFSFHWGIRPAQRCHFSCTSWSQVLGVSNTESTWWAGLWFSKVYRILLVTCSQRLNTLAISCTRF